MGIRTITSGIAVLGVAVGIATAGAGAASADALDAFSTPSGNTKCQVTSSSVTCAVNFRDGGWGIVETDRNGNVSRIQGNTGPTTRVSYGTYTYKGWNITLDESGSKFINADTGKGMKVKRAGVTAYQ